jgi:hypothetical protein
MKKIILMLFVMAIGVISVNAKDIRPVSETVKKSFSREFISASDVAWTWIEEKNVYKATFSFNGRQLNAYFTADGQFVGTTRYISKEQMPVIVLQQLEKKYRGYYIRTVIEQASKDQTSYYISVESEKNALMIKATPAGDLTNYQKLAKY